MSFKITNNSLLQKHYLAVDSSGVKYSNGQMLGARNFRFHEVESVLLSPEHTLSFQVGNEVFSIPVNMEDADHKIVIDFLLQEVRRTTE